MRPYTYVPYCIAQRSIYQLDLLAHFRIIRTGLVLHMSTFNMIIVIAIFLGMIAADGCPIVASLNGSCCEIQSYEFRFSNKVKSHIYSITNFCGDCELVAEGYCDVVTAGGGWLVIQKRQDGSVDFNRDWIDYEEGFGTLTGEFWYGLRAICFLTNQGQW